MLQYESLNKGTRERVEQYALTKGCSIDEALEEVVIEGIAMGGLTLAGRPKGELKAINAPPKGQLQIRTSTTDPN